MSKLIVVSPHLDDAVFSCWHSLNIADVVITVFAGIPPDGTSAWWDRLCGEKDSSKMIKNRIAENNKALAYSKSKAINLNFLDAQYRKDSVGAKDIAQEIANNSSLTDIFMVNLGGSAWCHKDHILTREAGIELLNQGCSVSFYADIPYMSLPGNPSKLFLNQMQNKATKLTHRSIEVIATKLDDQSYLDKIAAVKEYASQYQAINLTSFGRLDRYLKSRYELEFKVIA